MDKDFLTVVKEISDKLTEKNLTLGIAESCTGGFISNQITNLPGASRFFEIAVISYSERAKKSLLGIRASFLKKHGVVSEETSAAMAAAVRKAGNTDVSLSVTGIAGPETTEGKDIGLVFISVAIGDLVESRGVRFTGDREEIKRRASLEALNFLNRVLDLWI
jgi:PncC family amidohydrolase